MKNALLVIFVLAAIAYIYFRSNPKVDFKEDPEGGIQFHKGDWQAALDLAKKENKVGFLGYIRHMVWAMQTTQKIHFY